MAARGRVDVHERDRALVLVDARRRDLAGDDLAEEAALGTGGHAASISVACERSCRDRAHLRQAIAHLATIDRPSGLARASARRRSGSPRSSPSSAAASRVEEERAHGGYWFPLGVPNALAGAAGLLARRGGARGRALAAAVGAFAAAAIWDDVGGGRAVVPPPLPAEPARPGTSSPRRATRAPSARSCSSPTTTRRTGGCCSTPACCRSSTGSLPGLLARSNTSPPLMAPVIAGPLLVALGALTGRRRPLAAGAVLALGSAATFAEIGARDAVPGANDNLTGVATLIGLATRAAPSGRSRALRVLLVSTGSEEGFMEGMQAFARRHFPRSRRSARTSSASTRSARRELTLIEGEGMLRMRDYPDDFKRARRRRARATPASSCGAGCGCATRPTG